MATTTIPEVGKPLSGFQLFKDRLKTPNGDGVTPGPQPAVSNIATPLPTTASLQAPPVPTPASSLQSATAPPIDPESVSSRLTGLLAKDSPLMQQARTTGLQQANRRGLLNSSIAVGAAQNAMIGAALPIASQEASQANAKELTRMSIGSQERIAAQSIAAFDRQYAIGALTAMEQKYGGMWAEIVKNNNIPAAARENYFTHIAALRDSDMSLIEQLYSVDIDWASPVSSAA